MGKLSLVWWPFISTAFWHPSVKTDAVLGRTEVGFALEIFVSIVIFIVSLQYWRICGYQILGPRIDYTNCKSEKMRLELKMLPCSLVPNRGLAEKLIYKSLFVKYCCFESNTLFYGAGNSVVCFYFLTLLDVLAFFYLLCELKEKDTNLHL